MVLFRDFEERDEDFIYQCKNDENLNKMIVGKYRKYSHDDARQWVAGVIRADKKDMKFWAVCTNDQEKRIVGWMSLSGIDYENQKACLNGIVIANPDYRDGFAWIECHLFVLEYVFETLKLNRLYGESLVGHRDSNSMEEIMFFTREGIRRQAYFKNNRFYDSSYVSILKDEYFYHKERGDYETRAIIKRIGNSRKNRKK